MWTNFGVLLEKSVPVKPFEQAHSQRPIMLAPASPGAGVSHGHTAVWHRSHAAVDSGGGGGCPAFASRPEGWPWNCGPPGGGQLQGGICVYFPDVCRTVAPGLRWRFRVFLPPAVQGGSVGMRPPHAACSGPKPASRDRCRRRRDWEPVPCLTSWAAPRAVPFPDLQFHEPAQDVL